MKYVTQFTLANHLITCSIACDTLERLFPLRDAILKPTGEVMRGPSSDWPAAQSKEWSLQLHLQWERAPLEYIQRQTSHSATSVYSSQ